MSRKRNNRGKSGAFEGAGNPTTLAQETTAMAEIAAGSELPDHELTVLGFGNINRYFDLQDATNGPNFILRRATPYANFILGYSDGVISDQDTGAAINTGSSATAALNPILHMPTYFEADVWPILSNLFSSGTGQRYNVSISEFVRYQAMLLHAYTLMLDIIRINHLAYHFDWTKVYPFSDTVPVSLYDVATKLDATDVGIANLWLPLIKRFDNKIAFPRMIQEIKRMSDPLLSIDLNGRLKMVGQTNWYDPNIDISSYYDTIKAELDYIDVNLANASALITSFLPFPMSAAAPWSLSATPRVDLDLDSGWWNSGTTVYSSFGDTGDRDWETSI